MSREFIDAKELGRRLKVTRETVLAWQRRGWIPCLRAGRRPVLFDPVEVERALRFRGAVLSYQGDPSAAGSLEKLIYRFRREGTTIETLDGEYRIALVKPATGTGDLDAFARLFTAAGNAFLATVGDRSLRRAIELAESVEDGGLTIADVGGARDE